MRKAVAEYKGKSEKQLAAEVWKLRLEIAKLVQEFKVNIPKDTNSISKKRKKLAVLETFLTQTHAKNING